MSYPVMVDDNFHSMDERHRYTKGDYPTYAEALWAGLIVALIAFAGAGPAPIVCPASTR